ncbi:bifunctional alpha,alpha-trehalose-phosphate synthase (UDP-forming)/trehalose-phosphatase [Thermosulfurimonas sp. F29]|uniref:bifunctional alpha,alpha-trehalose-phosphate synthase (UDP-forming)/trehalose-phosphatase n=1 Tax=Thermosulfurimonas sp. F29 TaxID=2867247 RepID=UPI001C83BA79|nr:bifunctional alpha,alpha-trehalose-phosphate synthase (UDP-forming)/trehalose-phosphatase [Thermosulfurimonas sp. F29]MBX6423920.1 bifunctional alpha,alpha-trehalose-phosphate synthase (UDP-forming)/trehalose-phosphatase [Thermosulfurimonas sp. F29]
MARFVVVSNRLPVTLRREGEGFTLKPSVGGLATALSSVIPKEEACWVGWPGLSSEELAGHETWLAENLRPLGCYPVCLSREELDTFYYGFSNRTLWPLCHYFLQYAVFDRTFWEGYRRVNEKYAEAVAELAEEEATIWVHDYQLFLLPGLLRKKLPRATIGFFLHIPFPSYEIFRVLPWRREILEGLLGADLIGFHTYDYARHFLSCLRRLMGYEHQFGLVLAEDRAVKVEVFPISIDYARFASAPEDPGVRENLSRIEEEVGGRRLILSVDRLDYTKGIPERLRAYEAFLERHPEFRERVVLILIGVPSRTEVEHYQELKREVEELVGRINGRFGTLSWTPVHYLARGLGFEELAALYYSSDVALVTPLRDGMNLIAKEYVATVPEDKGVLILSEMAGAAAELSEALLVNPFNQEDLVAALYEALRLPRDEKRVRNRRMKERLRRYDINRWTRDFISTLREVRHTQKTYTSSRLAGEERERILAAFARAESPILFLDYDGTLVGFSGRPEKVAPDEELRTLLGRLGAVSRVVLISGRDPDTLDRWFGDLPVDLVAEHGVFIREGGRWHSVREFDQDWKEVIRPLLELYTDRTPGSFVEEKSCSLVWHYRLAESELGSMRAYELKEALLDLVHPLGLMVLEGNKVLEVKPREINKGVAARHFLESGAYDFVLAMGDDWTDEYLFEALPPESFTVKIGYGLTRARYRVENFREARRLLEELWRRKS